MNYICTHKPEATHLMHIGILLIATRRYFDYIAPLYASIDKYFLTAHKRAYFLFTDSKAPLPSGVQRISVKHKKWPYMTLHRYHFFLSIAERIRAQKIEVLYFFDADMQVIQHVGDEILPTKKHPLVCVIKEAFHGQPGCGLHERNSTSTACIHPHERYPYYIVGGFQGGHTETYLAAAQAIKKNIDIDEQKGMVAVWHDESHWNRYMASYTHLFKFLDPNYCFPNHVVGRADRLQYKPKILSLRKKDSWIRNQPLIQLREKAIWMGWKLNGLWQMLRRGRFRSMRHRIQRLLALRR